MNVTVYTLYYTRAPTFCGLAFLMLTIAQDFTSEHCELNSWRTRCCRSSVCKPLPLAELAELKSGQRIQSEPERFVAGNFAELDFWYSVQSEFGGSGLPQAWKFDLGQQFSTNAGRRGLVVATNTCPKINQHLTSSCFLGTRQGFFFYVFFDKNHQLSGVMLPDTLQSLTFGRYWSQSLGDVMWPQRLQHLAFGASARRPLFFSRSGNQLAQVYIKCWHYWFQFSSGLSTFPNIGWKSDYNQSEPINLR